MIMLVEIISRKWLWVDLGYIDKVGENCRISPIPGISLAISMYYLLLPLKRPVSIQARIAGCSFQLLSQYEYESRYPHAKASPCVYRLCRCFNHSFL
ncbi:hypothetical protein ACN38_g10246 [Penicillium nordicum]|uniref:Uncharacterized protein n=1 Tax=Penicillium nordicum TaxID=229535 RepID=A0A0M8P279_9EURO|nr:hypothetical protein ACN38_g10246 [Penicillium nordicum]